jgi:hypothetical protein
MNNAVCGRLLLVKLVPPGHDRRLDCPRKNSCDRMFPSECIHRSPWEE